MADILFFIQSSKKFPPPLKALSQKAQCYPITFSAFCDVVKKVLALIFRHGFQFWHDAFQKTTIQKDLGISLLAKFSGQLAVKHFGSVFRLGQLFLGRFEFGITFFKGGKQFYL